MRLIAFSVHGEDGKQVGCGRVRVRPGETPDAAMERRIRSDFAPGARFDERGYELRWLGPATSRGLHVVDLCLNGTRLRRFVYERPEPA